MNKKSLLLILFLIISIIISIYVSSEYLSNKKRLLSIDIVSLEVKEDSITPKSATFTLKSHKKDAPSYTYGEDFILEKKEKDNWESIVPIVEDYGFSAIGFTLFPGDERDIEVVWEWVYGDLPKGEYRIKKNIYPNLEEYDFKEYYIAAEFNID